ncbi:MAG: protein kinase domain-containing protein [Candidatus Brocadiia bacterium]
MQITCPRCGEPFTSESPERVVRCPECGHEFDRAEGVETPPMAHHAARKRDHDDRQDSSEEDAESEGDGLEKPSMQPDCPECRAPYGPRVEKLKGGFYRCMRCGAVFSPDRSGPSVGQSDSPDRSPSAAGLAETKEREGFPVTVTQAEREAEDDETAGINWLQERLGDRYEILEKIGRGGMGLVYRARQKNPSRIVALKVMRGGALSSEKARKRFRREAEAAARIQHSAIVPVYEVGEVGGQPYYTMAYVEGENLQTYVLENSPERAEICRIIAEVCRAVDSAHRHGIVHRDLKPGNILITEEGEIHILDFGLARMIYQEEGEKSLLTKSGDILGTPHYMSPEQATGAPEEIDSRSDVYSIGVMLYELTVGMPPYNLQGLQGMEALKVVRDADPVRPSLVHPLISRDLEAIILKAIEKEKSARYRSAAAFARDLDNFIEDRPVNAQPRTLGYRMRKFIWRNRKTLLPGVAVFLIFLLIASVVGGMWLGATREARQLKAELQQVAGGVDNVSDYIVRQAEDGNWENARSNARFAESTWPDRSEIKGLVDRIRKMAMRRVDSLIEQRNSAVRNQDYQKARKLNERLSGLASRMPFNEPAQRAREETPGFRTLCLADLKKVLQQAHVYTREDCVDRIDRFLDEFEEGDQARAASQWREKYNNAEPEFYAQLHLRAVRRNIDKGAWEEARRVLREARKFMTGEKLDGSERLRERSEELEHRIKTTIWPGTVPDLRLREMLHGHTQFVKTVAFHRTFDRLIATGGTDDTVRLWNGQEGTLERTIPLPTSSRAVAFHPEDKRLAAGDNDGTIRVWSLNDGQELLNWGSGHKMQIKEMEFTPDGTLLLSGSVDSLRLWKMGEENAGRRRVYAKARMPFALSTDGSRIYATTHDGSVGVWNLEESSPAEVWKLPFVPAAIDTCPSGEKIAAGGKEGAVVIRNLRSGKLLHFPPVHSGKVMAVCFSPDGRLLATAGRDTNVILWDVSGNDSPENLRTLTEHEGWVFDVAFSPDGRLIASVGNDGHVNLWDVDAERAGNR